MGLLVVAADEARAQPTAPLFGRRSTKPKEALDLAVSLVGGYDDNLAQDVEGQPTQPSLIQTGGYFTGLNPRLDFTSHIGGTQIGVTSTSDVRYYAPQHQVVAVSYGIGAGISTALTRRTTLVANQSTVYSPALLYRLFAVATPPTLGELSGSAPNYNVKASDTYAYTTDLSVTQRVTRTITVASVAELHYTTFTNNTDYTNARSWGLGPRVGYDVTRNLHLHVSYLPQFIQYGRIERSNIHTVNFGFTLERARSRNRRTSLTVGIGPIFQHFTDLRPEIPAERRLSAVGGDVNFSRQFTRAWSFSGSLHRGVEFTEVLASPVITNGGTLAVSGHLFPRTDITASGSYTNGEAVAVGTPAHLSTYSGDITLRFALTRSTSMTAQYLRYQYTLTDLQPIALAAGLPPNLTRNAVRIGIVTGVPVWRR